MVATRKPAGNDEKKDAKKQLGCEMKITNIKGAWSKQEDQKLIDYIQKHGEGCWSSLPQSAGLLRCGKSCRLRWVNYLKPDVKRGNFGEDEEDLIIKLHALLGNRWSLIAGRLPGRTDNEVKNYWNSHLKKKMIKMGIDPSNHRLMTERAPGSSNPVTSGAGPAAAAAADDEAVVGLDSTCGSASKTIISSLPDLNLNLSLAAPSVADYDQQMQLLLSQEANYSHREFGTAHPFTTLLLFG